MSPADATAVARITADPATVALLRELYAHARKVHAEHVIYAHGDGTGRPVRPFEHVWTLGPCRVSYQDGALVYERHGLTILSGAGFDDVRQAAQVLAAIGVLPERFIGGAK